MNQKLAKQAAAREAVKLVENGMVVGLGTGSTAEEMLVLLGERVAQGLAVTGVPTSRRCAELALAQGIPLWNGLPDFSRVDITLDGADEVDPKGHLVKGGGGALLREKLVAAASRRLIIMVDEGKHVERLCSTRGLPVEIIPYGWSAIMERLREAGGEPVLRGGSQPFLTDQGNYIVDCQFPPVEQPGELQERLAAIPGVVETGLFVGMVTTVVTGREDGAAVSRSYLPAAPRYAKA